MWLKDSSIGRKLVMSVTGLALVLFLLFHASMNIALIFSEDAYNWICEMLGANWYAIIGTLGLALLVLIHFLYALYLTIQNRRARGNDRYAVTTRQDGVDWNSKNMLVLGLIVLGFLVLHLANFWFKMQFQELFGLKTGAFDPQNGAAYVKYLFSGVYDPAAVQEGVNFTPCASWIHPLYCGLYLVWLAAIWFHLTHGIWSALQTLGWSNLIWLKRIKVIGCIFATLIVLMFASVVVYYLGMYVGTYCA
ncbi:MAG: succinate dehydrogenase/fumarate reductase cytochrome b subunit [Paludibacter sp.]|nr:succinate dehydrogenase/fumarate reductase cytochrome b subunit [Bacteroidales bacterium]MCM1069554.1 succinate dehydrogenase/fumarate reductase cytochrome b subunit [Prevotella sp.]MCM1354200.1 succinate dehydrogenase/fumarate reductase cytochrome b subunit [Bacteroides sp.]MCM1443061.1 succinate dehydrogenase/fumarate reductase cytochrome b subunit [Muribaculum sp.]MCM1482274.1 succinate dehydrogenase/fumarate reductase cytochrome b subunit [Paludibacter sp.]